MCERDKVIAILLKSGKTVSTAESCTGGLLGAAFTDYPGVSASYLEGAVTYANEAKIRLGVKEETLRQFGAVSHETAREMAECIRVRSGSDFGISTTGIAGPGGGTAKKPVGLVYVAISTKEKTCSYALRLEGNRQQIRQKTVCSVFRLLKKLLGGEKHGEI